jgi:hypothetical protein
MTKNIPVTVNGRCIISDDLGNIILDKTNAIHSQNMSMIFARGLANESNHSVFRIALGNGGTFYDATSNIQYNTTNTSNWDSRLYNETYSKSTNDVTINSSEVADYARVTLVCTLNKEEPSGEYLTSSTSGQTLADTVYAFDEIGLFSDGLSSNIPTSGYQSVIIGTPNLYVDTGLSLNKIYKLTLNIDKSSPKTYQLSLGSATSGKITFIDLIALLNNTIPNAIFSMDNGASANALLGYLKITSKTTGTSSSIEIINDFNNDSLLYNIPLFQSINKQVDGTNGGTRNDPLYPDKELSRMLTHLVFDPVKKPADQIYVIRYILDIKVNPKKAI